MAQSKEIHISIKVDRAQTLIPLVEARIAFNQSQVKHCSDMIEGDLEWLEELRETTSPTS